MVATQIDLKDIRVEREIINSKSQAGTVGRPARIKRAGRILCYHPDVPAIPISHEHLKQVIGIARLLTQADKSDFAPVRGPGRRFRSYGCKPADTAAISIHKIYFASTFPVAGEEDSSVGRPV